MLHSAKVIHVLYITFISIHNQLMPATSSFKMEYCAGTWIELICRQSKTNISSISFFKTREMSIANFNEGLYFPASRRIIVSLLTFTFSASSSCVSPAAILYSFKWDVNSAIILVFFEVKEAGYLCNNSTKCSY